MEALACISIPPKERNTGLRAFWFATPADDNFSGISNSNIGEGLMVNHSHLKLQKDYHRQLK